MKKFVICLLIAFSLFALCACGESEQEKAARRLDEANRALSVASDAARQATQNLNDFNSAWSDYQSTANALNGG